jgi:hypothetical protein
MMQDETNDGDETPFDRQATDADIRKGAAELTKLFKRDSEDFASWEAAIVGWRGLRNLAFEAAGVSDIHAQRYRDAMQTLLAKKKYAIYDELDNPTRSAMHKLCVNIEQIALWYGNLPRNDRLRWKHPSSIVKALMEDPDHRHLVSGGLGHNKPPPSRSEGKKKPASTAREDALRALVIAIVNEFVLPVNPQRAAELLKKLYPEGDPNDDIGIGGD